MKLSKLMMACAMCAVTLTGTAQTKVIAHRGYWKCEGSAQNSIASLPAGLRPFCPNSRLLPAAY